MVLWAQVADTHTSATDTTITTITIRDIAPAAHRPKTVGRVILGLSFQEEQYGQGPLHSPGSRNPKGSPGFAY